MSQPSSDKLGAAPTDTFLLDGVPTSIQAVKNGEIPGMRWDEATQSIQRAKMVTRNGYGKLTYSDWGSGEDASEPNPSNYTVITEDGDIPLLLKEGLSEDSKAFAALLKIGESIPLRNWLSGEGRQALEENSDSDSMDLVQIKYLYQNFLATNPIYEDQQFINVRDGAEPVLTGYAPDLESMRQAVYQGLTDALAEQYVKLAQQQIDAINAQTKALDDLKKAQELEIANQRADFLANENLVEFIGRKLTEGGEGQTKSWEDFFNRVLPRIQTVGNLAQSGIETYEYTQAPTDPKLRRVWQQEQRLQSRIIGGYTEMLKEFQKVTTEQTLAAKVQVQKESKVKPYAKTKKVPKYRVKDYYVRKNK